MTKTAERIRTLTAGQIKRLTKIGTAHMAKMYEEAGVTVEGWRVILSGSFTGGEHENSELWSDVELEYCVYDRNDNYLASFGGFVTVFPDKRRALNVIF